jgi:phosphoglycerate dehydrogenase-like enzyme
MKVLLTKPFFEKDIQYIKNRVHKEVELIVPNEYSDDVLAGLAPDCEVLFGPYLSDALLSNAKNAKLIHIPWTGVDNLNFDLINKYSIPVANSHSYALIDHEKKFF